MPNTSNCPHICSWGDDPDTVNGDGITNNLLGGNSQSEYLSPMQAGQIHRSLAITSVRKYAKCNKSNIPLVVEGDELWDFDLKLYRNLVIEQNATLTLNCKLVMHPDARIIVKPGGNLLIDGGVITTDIFQDEPWQGIQVWGNSDSSQYCITEPCPQGKLEIINGGTIENAEIGVDLWHPDHWNSMGGIVQAEDAVFDVEAT